MKRRRISGIEVAVGMGDEGPGETEDPRIAGERPLGQFRQLAIVAGRQVVANLADLLLDEVIVVEQPFGGRNDASAALQFRGARPVGGEQDGGVVVEPRAQRQNRRGSRRHRLRGGEALRMLLEPFDAEEFLSDRRLVVPGRRRRAMAPGVAEDGGHESLWRRAPCAK